MTAARVDRDDQEPRAGKRRFSLQWKLLLAFLALAVVPLVAVEWFVHLQLAHLRQLADQTARTYERRAARIAKRVAALLHDCERDLATLARLPREEQAYLDFSRSRQREVWIRTGTNDRMLEERVEVPLYREIAFIDPDGRERVSVARGQPVPAEQHRDVSQPENTTYRNERYFSEAIAAPPGEIYVSHLNGFHVNRFEQLGLDQIIPRLTNRDARTKRVYRYLMYEMLRAAGAVEFVNSFREDGHRVLVYREPGAAGRILIPDPGRLSPAELQARELELEELIEQLAPEDVIEGERYDGVIRFATAVAGEDGSPAGVVVLGLDHLHLMQFTQHVKAMEENATVFAGYRDADYTYLYDDQGWIITHPKFWNIRGVDRTGQPIPAYTPQITEAQRLVGRRAVNLLQLDWRMGQGYHAVVLETRAGKTGIATTNNLAGVLRTRVYSPIFYDTGDYARHGIFGGVMLGTRVDKFIELLRKMNERIGQKVDQLRRSIYWPLLVVVGLVCLLAVLIARGLVKPIRQLQLAARRIGGGALETPVPEAGRDEIGELARSFAGMTASLRRSIDQLEQRNRDLKQAQQKLIEAERAKQQQLQQEVAELQREIKRASFSDMVASSPQMKKIQEEIVRVADSSATVLILGEHGTGKELVAAAIHRNSARRDKHFLKVNCAAYNDNLLESELFGHVKGAYTGATSARKGLFEAADGGTLLLDEIGDMSLEMQKKLLRTLQEGEVVPIGSNKVIAVDVRLIAATNRDLKQRMRDGHFREDLFHRLNVISIHIPPLRERREDILPLAHRFIRRFADKEDKPVSELSPEAERFLRDYPWPGNVRELENAVERAVIRSRGQQLRVEDFQLDPQRADEELPEVRHGAEARLTLAEVEKAYILRILEENAGNKKATAKQLGIGYNTLWRKLKKYQQ
jgi:DNA-binding NtrC family response regulator/HAMP domain-containing protein